MKEKRELIARLHSKEGCYINVYILKKPIYKVDFIEVEYKTKEDLGTKNKHSIYLKDDEALLIATGLTNAVLSRLLGGRKLTK